MSLLPLLLDFSNNPLDDAFGYGLYPNQLLRPTLNRQPNVSAADLWPRLFICPWFSEPRNKTKQAVSLNKTDSGINGFQVCMDVQHFQPNEITVKTVNSTVMIEAEHEEKADELGLIYRHFIRRYELPKEIDVNDVVSTLSSDGVLTIKAPPKHKNERIITIQQTGSLHLSVTSNEKDNNTKAEENIAE